MALKLDFGAPVMEILAKTVQKEANHAAMKMSQAALTHTPIWSGRMINSWMWFNKVEGMKPVPYWDGVMRTTASGAEFPANPLPRPGLEDVVPNFSFESTEFPRMYFTCSVDWAYEVDQGKGRYSKPARNIVKHAIQEASR